jgi:hypothetical protein
MSEFNSPWVREEDGVNTIIRDTTGFKVCECWHFLDAQHELNVNLIAAAPDLLAALIKVVAIADRKTDEFDQASDAIAKALGEQQ